MGFQSFACLFVCFICTRLAAKEISSLETPMGADFKKPQLKPDLWGRERGREHKGTEKAQTDKTETL